jgi:glutathione peroxidase
MKVVMNIYDFEAKHNKGEAVSLSMYSGKVLLIFNTATKYGLTPQYGDIASPL